MEYTDHIRCLATLDPALAEELAGFTSLEQVLPWMMRRGLPSDGLDVLAQDEYSHDLLVPLGDGRYVTFGMT
jgi:hypothetical protein